jgi:hypothetical protein
MAHLVRVNTHFTTLPDGETYPSGAEVVLTEEQFGRLAPGSLGDEVTDLGYTDDATLADLKATISADLLTLTRLERETTQRLARRNAAAAQRRADATTYTETWADGSGWTGGSTVVTGGRMYNATGAFRPAPTTTRWVARVTLHTTGVAGKFAYFGVLPASHANGEVLAIGQGSGSTTAAINRGATIPAAQVVIPRPLPALAAGDYLLTIAKDETHLTFTIQATPTGQAVYGARVALSALPNPPADLYLAANDTTAGGMNFGPVVIHSDLAVPPLAARTVSGTALFSNTRPLVFFRADPATGFGHYVSIPGDNDPRVPAPVVLFCHQSLSATAPPGMAPWMESRWANVLAALTAAGYIVATSDNGPALTAGGSQDRYGNQSGQDDYLALVEWVRQHAATGPLFLLGASMGAYFVHNLVGGRALGGIAAAATISGGTDLRLALGNQPYRPRALAAYGAANDADVATKPEGFNPIDGPGPTFRGLPHRFYAGSTDTLAPPEATAEAMAAKVQPYGPEAGVVTVATGHLGDGLYQGSDLVAFFDRYR